MVALLVVYHWLPIIHGCGRPQGSPLRTIDDIDLDCTASVFCFERIPNVLFPLPVGATLVVALLVVAPFLVALFPVH